MALTGGSAGGDKNGSNTTTEPNPAPPAPPYGWWTWDICERDLERRGNLLS